MDTKRIKNFFRSKLFTLILVLVSPDCVFYRGDRREIRKAAQYQKYIEFHSGGIFSGNWRGIFNDIRLR